MFERAGQIEWLEKWFVSKLLSRASRKNLKFIEFQVYLQYAFDARKAMTGSYI